MNRRRTGAAAWVASALLLPAQLLVAARWPEGYSVTANAISDLGVTGCGVYSEQGQQVRDVCSPWHPVFNVAMVASGALIAMGAVLLHGWWGGRSGRSGTALLAVGGLLVAVVGLAPWDIHPGLHDGAALGQAVAQWLAMGLLAAAAGPGAFRRLTLGTAVVSVVGFLAFVAALEGAEVPVVGFGGAERLSFDTLTVWTALVGATLLRSRAAAGVAPSTGARAVATGGR